MSGLLVPDLTPNLSQVRSIVTTKWGASSYRPLVIPKIESYYVDTALDSDADTWTMEIGDPRGQYLDMLKRDSEIRVQLFGVGQESTNFLMTGLADEVEFNEQGTWTLTGRDLSSLAIDSTIPPAKFSHVRAWYLVESQARKLGFKQTSLTRKPMVKKVQHTDGNETYWEFWYRLYRKEQMWLWTTANGILVAAPLDYGQAPTYYFGRPTGSESPNIKQRYIPVLSASIRKSTQSRIYEVWVYGNKGDTGFFSKSTDPTIADWIKKPLKIFQDTEAHTERSAQKLGWEEIFEGKVGSLEIKVTIPDPGFVIKPNRVAIIRIPEIDFAGDFYVVGARYAGGPDGFFQEVRLRERRMALSRRIPKDPVIQTSEAPRTKSTAKGLGEVIAAIAPMPPAWIAYFISAAKEWHGPWDFNLFLATLIGICDQETGGTFTNIRANGGPGGSHIEWYPWKKVRTQGPLTYGQAIGDKFFPEIGENRPKPGQELDVHGRTREEYEEIFANEPGKYTGKTWAVGLMQLYSLSFKHDADDHMRSNFHDQYAGGRWHPEHSIWAAAKALRQFLKNMVKDSGRDIDIWAGVSGYGQHDAGETASTVPTKYALAVKTKVLKQPGYFSQVSDALKSVRESAAAATEGFSEGAITDSGQGEDGLPSKAEVDAFFSGKDTTADSKPSGSATTKKRVMIQAGHDTGGHADQPYGHTGESGASGEQAFTQEIRNKALTHFANDDRFDAASGNAWSASAGATVSTDDDIDWHGDVFVSIHYDIGTAGTGFFFGFTRGATDGRPAAMNTNSVALANGLTSKLAAISGSPGRNVGADNAVQQLWGYYAWGSTLRSSPDDVSHLPGIEAAVLVECGRASDTTFVNTKRDEIARAIYEGVCVYYGFTPV